MVSSPTYICRLQFVDQVSTAALRANRRGSGGSFSRHLAAAFPLKMSHHTPCCGSACRAVANSSPSSAAIRFLTRFTTTLSLFFFFFLFFFQTLLRYTHTTRGPQKTRHCIHMLGYNMAQLGYLVVADERQKNKTKKTKTKLNQQKKTTTTQTIVKTTCITEFQGILGSSSSS